MNDVTKTKLKDVLDNLGPEKIRWASGYIAAKLSLKFHADFCAKYNVHEDQYNSLFAIALDYDKRTPKETEKMIAEELKNKVVNREIIKEYLPFFIEEIKKNKFVESAQDAGELSRALDIYFEFYKHTIGSENYLDACVIDAVTEYSRELRERDLHPNIDAENHSKPQGAEREEPMSEEEMAKIFDIKTGKRI